MLEYLGYLLLIIPLFFLLILLASTFYIPIINYIDDKKRKNEKIVDEKENIIQEKQTNNSIDKNDYEKKILLEKRKSYEQGKADAYKEMERIFKNHVKPTKKKNETIKNSNQNNEEKRSNKKVINNLQKYIDKADIKEKLLVNKITKNQEMKDSNDPMKPKDLAMSLIDKDINEALEFKENLSFFLSHLPREMYHVFDGTIKKHIDLNLFFESDGKKNFVKDTFAILDSISPPVHVYLCAHNKFIFNIVKPTGIFSITGLKTISAIEAKNEEEFSIIMQNLEQLKRVES